MLCVRSLAGSLSVLARALAGAVKEKGRGLLEVAYTLQTAGPFSLAVSLAGAGAPRSLCGVCRPAPLALAQCTVLEHAPALAAGQEGILLIKQADRRAPPHFTAFNMTAVTDADINILALMQVWQRLGECAARPGAGAAVRGARSGAVALAACARPCPVPDLLRQLRRCTPDSPGCSRACNIVKSLPQPVALHACVCMQVFRDIFRALSCSC